MIGSLAAELAATAWNTGLHSNTITGLQVLDLAACLDDYAG